MTEPLIDRCVCHDRTFAEILEMARAVGVTDLAELRLHVDFGQGCGTCRPSIRIALESGRTRLPVLAEETS